MEQLHTTLINPAAIMPRMGGRGRPVGAAGLGEFQGHVKPLTAPRRRPAAIEGRSHLMLRLI